MSKNAVLFDALRAMRGNVDVSTINNSKRSTARWSELVQQADAALAYHASQPPAQLTGITPALQDFARYVAASPPRALRGMTARSELDHITEMAKSLLARHAKKVCTSCVHCGTPISNDAQGTWIDRTGGDGCIDSLGGRQLVHSPKA